MVTTASEGKMNSALLFAPGRCGRSVFFVFSSGPWKVTGECLLHTEIWDILFVCRLETIEASIAKCVSCFFRSFWGWSNVDMLREFVTRAAALTIPSSCFLGSLDLGWLDTKWLTSRSVSRWMNDNTHVFGWKQYLVGDFVGITYMFHPLIWEIWPPCFSNALKPPTSNLLKQVMTSAQQASKKSEQHMSPVPWRQSQRLFIEWVLQGKLVLLPPIVWWSATDIHFDLVGHVFVFGCIPVYQLIGFTCFVEFFGLASGQSLPRLSFMS